MLNRFVGFVVACGIYGTAVRFTIFRKFEFDAVLLLLLGGAVDDGGTDANDAALALLFILSLVRTPRGVRPTIAQQQQQQQRLLFIITGGQFAGFAAVDDDDVGTRHRGGVCSIVIA